MGVSSQRSASVPNDPRQSPNDPRQFPTISVSSQRSASAPTVSVSSQRRASTPDGSVQWTHGTWIRFQVRGSPTGRGRAWNVDPRTSAVAGTAGSGTATPHAAVDADAHGARSEPCDGARPPGNASAGARRARSRNRPIGAPLAPRGIRLALPTSGRHMPVAKDVVRIAALGDIHHGRNATPGALQPLFGQINDSAATTNRCGAMSGSRMRLTSPSVSARVRPRPS